MNIAIQAKKALELQPSDASLFLRTFNASAGRL